MISLNNKPFFRTEEDNVLRKFRMLLRKILGSLAKERKFQVFLNPVDITEVPDYYSIITNPIDLSTMRQKVDLYNYNTFEEFRNVRIISYLYYWQGGIGVPHILSMFPSIVPLLFTILMLTELPMISKFPLFSNCPPIKFKFVNIVFESRKTEFNGFCIEI